MQYIKLGNSGLEVSPICIGCMGFGEPSLGHPTWALGEEGSRPVVKHAIEAGINFFDTANLYSQGTSKENIGKLLKEFAKRESIVIATKLGAPTRPGPNAFGLSRKAIMTEVDNSLRRLGTDYIDLYQIHRADPFTPRHDPSPKPVPISILRQLRQPTRRSWRRLEKLQRNVG